MPMPTTRERHNELERAAYQRRKRRAIEYLGGRCVRCGTRDGLEFDHIDPSTRSFVITGRLSGKWTTVQPELDKCQLLCKPCHRAKTVENGETAGGWNKRATVEHGTVTTYTDGCRCEPCREAKSVARGSKTRRSQGRAEHGSKVMYSYHRCRCDACREGQRLRARERNSRLTGGTKP